jgi:hypothetical protein
MAILFTWQILKKPATVAERSEAAIETANYETESKQNITFKSEKSETAKIADLNLIQKYQNASFCEYHNF